VRLALDALIVCSAAVLFLIAGFGGIEIEIGGLSIRARDWLRPAMALAIGAAGHIGIRRWKRQSHVGVAGFVARGMLALVVAAGLAYSQFHVRIAGGLDSYGYVSAAGMIASARLHEPQPLAAVLPFPDALSAATPLGHVPATDGQSSVPRFPLGLPLVMAAFSKFHSAGPYFVPLLMAYAALVLTYLIVRASSDQVTGLFAAALVAVDPVFAVSAIYPMSDVPATCWLLAAIWASQSNRGESWSWSATSGACAGMAVLTRPVLLPAAVVFLMMGIGKGATRCTVARTLTLAAFLILQVFLNAHLYGSATMSGYGSASHMFEVTPSRVSAAVANFGKWLMYSHTAPLWLAWPAALVVLRRERWVWEVSAIAAAAAVPYLFYIVFDNWASLRFLLPMLVLALLMSARALSGVTLTAAGRTWQPVVLLAIAIACSAAARQFVIREGVDRGRTDEEKYPLVGAWFREHTTERAVVLSSLHSGAIRLYSGRQTIRWDYIPGNALSATIDRLASLGYEAYLALDLPSEPPMFDERFRGESVTIEPVARVRVVNIYKFAAPRINGVSR
jgi:hypothetical protein